MNKKAVPNLVGKKVKIAIVGCQHLHILDSKRFDIVFTKSTRTVGDVVGMISGKMPGLRKLSLGMFCKGKQLIPSAPASSITSLLTLRNMSEKLPPKPRSPAKRGELPAKRVESPKRATPSPSNTSLTAKEEASAKEKVTARKSTLAIKTNAANKRLSSMKLTKGIPSATKDGDSHNSENGNAEQSDDEKEIVNLSDTESLKSSQAGSSRSSKSKKSTAPAVPPPLRRLKDDSGDEPGAKRQCNWGYLKLEDLSGFPRIHDVVAFKMMHLEKSHDQLFPKLSEFKEGKVIESNPKSRLVWLSLCDAIDVPDTSVVGPGKVHTIMVDWDTILFPKLVSRSSTRL